MTVELGHAWRILNVTGVHVILFLHRLLPGLTHCTLQADGCFLRHSSYCQFSSWTLSHRQLYEGVYSTTNTANSQVIEWCNLTWTSYSNTISRDTNEQSIAK